MRSLGKTLQSGLGFLGGLDRLVADKHKMLTPACFIAGPPRVGSTLTYQVLASTGSFDFFSNLDYLLYRSPNIALTITGLKKQKPYKSSFQSDIGFERGLFSPSEANLLWNYWFGFLLQEIDPEEVQDASRLGYIQSHLTKRLQKTGKPLLACWNAHAFYLESIWTLYDKPLIVNILRDPVDTSISILKAREHSKGDVASWWSMMPRDIADSYDTLSIEAQVMKQVHCSYQRVKAFEEQHPGKVVHLAYENLCRDPQGTALEIIDQMGASRDDRLEQAIPPEFPCSTGSNFREYREALLSEYAKYDWPFGL